jgi:hypothetical protein
MPEQMAVLRQPKYEVRMMRRAVESGLIEELMDIRSAILPHNGPRLGIISVLYCTLYSGRHSEAFNTDCYRDSDQ